MRILLTSSASHLPPRGGSTRGNLAWLEHLSHNGHSCCVVGGAPPAHSAEAWARIRRELQEEGLEPPAGASADLYRGIRIYSASKPEAQAALLREQITAFHPDWILVSSEDLSHVLLKEAQRHAPGRIIYLAHTPQFFPFGPASWNADANATGIVARAAGVIAIGNYMAEYIHLHCGRRPAVIHPPIYGEPPFPIKVQFANGAITMINPSAVKGISIFLALADAFPNERFAALPGWGTTENDRADLRARANITLLPNCQNIDEVFQKTRILLMPSLWLEGFGLVVVEAMLRGVPVIASNSGGLREAKFGTGFIAPVRQIDRYEPEFDDQGMPAAVIPQQDMTPWHEALSTLTGDSAAYDHEAELSRNIALKFVAGLSASHFESFLANLTVVPEAAATVTSGNARGLSPERRALLLRRLRKHS
ncbi:MAG: glycosyltransferase family 4 protein [Bryobacteraceae bacterium]